MRPEEKFYLAPHQQKALLTAAGLVPCSFIGSGFHIDCFFPHYDPNTIGLMRFHNPASKTHYLDKDFISCKVGRFLQRNYGHVLSDYNIQYIATQEDALMRPIRVCIARRPSAIRKVYEKGPDSCMSPGGDYWRKTGPQCCEAYASPDFGVAYMRNTEGHVSARAVVLPNKKLYGRVYGDSIRLVAGLTRMGYRPSERSSDWYGARLRAIPYRLRSKKGARLLFPVYLVPYADNFRYAIEVNKAGRTYLQIAETGPHVLMGGQSRKSEYGYLPQPSAIASPSLSEVNTHQPEPIPF